MPHVTAGFEVIEHVNAPREEPPATPSRAVLQGALSELREKGAMLVAAQRLTKLGSWVLNVDAGTFQWSDEAHRIFGLGQNELARLTLPEYFERVHPQDRPHVAELVREACSRKMSARFAYRILRPDGAVRLLRGEGESQLDATGRVVKLVGTIMDVTEQQLAHRDAASLQLLQEQVAVWAWEQDEQFRFTLLRDTHRQVAAMGRTRWSSDRVPVSGTWDDHRRVLMAHQAFTNFEYQVGHGEAARVISTTGVPVFADDGQFRGYRGTAIDVTEARKAQARAAQAQSLLEIAARLGRIGAWVLELPELAMRWSSEWSRIHELAEGAEPTWRDIVAWIHEPWRSKMVDAVKACMDAGGGFDVEVRASTAKGGVIWLRVVGEAVRDSAGEVRRIQGAARDMTDERKAAEELARVNVQLKATLESITDAFVTLDPQLRVTYANPEAEKLTGHPRARIVGKHLRELFPRFPGSTFEQEMLAALRSGVTSRFDAYSPTLDRWLRFAAYPSEAGLALYLRDITESREAKRALLESEERYRLLFEESGDAVIETQVETGIRRANPAACALFGLSEAQLKRLTCSQLVAPGDARLASIVEERVRSGRARGDLTMLRADGSVFEAEVSAATYRTHEGKLLTSLLIRDVSKRVEYERRIVALNDELARRVKDRTTQLEAANDELRSFAHALAHDLRSPIAAILAFGHTLHEDLAARGAEQERQHSARLVRAARQLGDHMDGLLAMYSISRAPLAMSVVDLSDMATSILDELQQRGHRAVVVQVQPGLSAYADARLLRIALENLLGNAWKFTSKRDPASISFTSTLDEENEVVYCVRDNGAGFDMARADQLFESFQRLHAASEFPGTGLGLATVKRVVVRHGGEIRAESVAGAGACFMFTLPGSAA